MQFIKTFSLSFVVSLILVGLFFWPTFYSQYFASAQDESSIEAFQSLVEAEAEDTHVKELSGIAEHISLPSVGIALPVAAGGPTDSTSTDWVLSWDKVHYDINRQNPNNTGGTTVLYGHNISSVLKNTASLKLGDKLDIKTTNNHVFRYKLRHVTDVLPTDLDSIKGKEEPVVFLITCSGSWNQHRSIMRFDLVKAIEAKT